MNRLDPDALFRRIAADVPADLRGHLFVTGSLAAAYHFQARLEGRAINTKDADLGLLRGMDLTAEMLKATGERLLLDAIEPLAAMAAG